jgi:hypothetical protein
LTVTAAGGDQFYEYTFGLSPAPVSFSYRAVPGVKVNRFYRNPARCADPETRKCHVPNAGRMRRKAIRISSSERAFLTLNPKTD